MEERETCYSFLLSQKSIVPKLRSVITIYVSMVVCEFSGNIFCRAHIRDHSLVLPRKFGTHHHHYQPIDVPTEKTQVSLWITHMGHNTPRGPIPEWWKLTTANAAAAQHAF
jgi:hypothetical protein